MPLITLFADASFCPDLKVGGGAYDIKCGGEHLTDNFMLFDIADAWEAEVVTYGYALRAIMQHPKLKNYLKEGSSICATLDCTGVETFIKGMKMVSLKGRHYPSSTLSVRELHYLVVRMTSVKIIFEHVKSHTNDQTIAAFRNSRVDELAKIAMNHARAIKRKKGKTSKKGLTKPKN